MGAASSQENDNEQSDEDLNLLETSKQISNTIHFDIHNAINICDGLKVYYLTLHYSAVMKFYTTLYNFEMYCVSS